MLVCGFLYIWCAVGFQNSRIVRTFRGGVDFLGLKMEYRIRLGRQEGSFRGGWGRLLTALWIATATLLFLGLSRQIGEASHAVVPALLMMLVGSFWTWLPVNNGAMAGGSRQVPGTAATGRPARRAFPLAVSAAVMVLSVAFGAQGLNRGFLSASKVSETELQNKKFFDELVDKMKNFPKDYVWGVYFEQALQQLRVTSFFRNGTALKIDEGFQFLVHESYWRMYFPGLDATAIAKLGVEGMHENADAVMVFSDPDLARIAWPSNYGSYLNPWSIQIAQRLSETAQDAVPR